MFVYKSQPRQHLKHDVPNFILCEHLILPNSRPSEKCEKKKKRKRENIIARERAKKQRGKRNSYKRKEPGTVHAFPMDMWNHSHASRVHADCVCVSVLMHVTHLHLHTAEFIFCSLASLSLTLGQFSTSDSVHSEGCYHCFQHKLTYAWGIHTSIHHNNTSQRVRRDLWGVHKLQDLSHFIAIWLWKFRWKINFFPSFSQNSGLKCWDSYLAFYYHSGNLVVCIHSHATARHKKRPVHLPFLWINDSPCKIWKLMFLITDSGNNLFL